MNPSDCHGQLVLALYTWNAEILEFKKPIPVFVLS